jgi:glyoxylase-like metal-dependent hydrolase (beta-lactamase superfamily II)
MESLAPNVYVETGYESGTVGAILTADGWLCVDTPPFPRDARHWWTALQNISSRPFLYVVNTGFHRDRVLGNVWFEAPVVAQEAAARKMLDLKPGFVTQSAEEMAANDNEFVEIASLKLVPPQISFDQALTLICGEREIVLKGMPGASTGSLWVVLEVEKVIFTGETTITQRHPRLRGPVSQAWLGVLNDIQDGLYREWTLVPGQGAVQPTPDVGRLIDYLHAVWSRVSDIVVGGRPRSDLGSYISELLPYFPYPDGGLDEAQRRIRAGLEAIYEEMTRPAQPEAKRPKPPSDRLSPDWD